MGCFSGGVRRPAEGVPRGAQPDPSRARHADDTDGGSSAPARRPGPIRCLRLQRRRQSGLRLQRTTRCPGNHAR